MPRPRKPTTLLERAGRFRKDPQRARPNEPDSPTHDWSSVPDYFSEDEEKAWHDIVLAAADGVLTYSDQLFVEMTARLLANLRTTEHSAADFAQLRISLSQLGLTPSGRASIEIPKATHNPFEDL
ncbi:MAG: hypothetical protein AAGM16_03220 [Pseudomonadota bacterium]